jgi:hypothetical protein
MTSLAFVLGVLPLAPLATAPARGPERDRHRRHRRRRRGHVLGVLLVPVFFVVIAFAVPKDVLATFVHCSAMQADSARARCLLRPK